MRTPIRSRHDLRSAGVQVVSSDGTAFYGKFDKVGRPTGPGGYIFPNGAYIKGSNTAPPLVSPPRSTPPCVPTPLAILGGVLAVRALTHVGPRGSLRVMRAPPTSATSTQRTSYN